ncbi:hypothetical protein [Chryseobacterium sp. JUb7]|uniref:hypothetical protein n=1 Tax=Chryseobacterium sp. JUb7 TaxID=2940599 RepID=UPI00216A06C9|nr:hypothetical protein [Chryseobacterium sp. JUb7]MCS3531025.1 hypothetical protein [Chryseobacterium sp. JUb7]
MMLTKTDFFFTYTLDDAYIHLALAKNFALHKIWGMTPYAFSSSSSSPMFTFILSVLIFIFGNNELIPLVFNLIMAFFSVYFLNKYYAQHFQKSQNIIIACIFTLFFAVVHLQIMAGMEHVLQLLIIIINIHFFQKWVHSDFKNPEVSYWFYFTIALSGLVRFESMFYFVSLAFVFCCLKKFKHAFTTLICGFLPILIFGYFNEQQSGYFLPNSVVVKGTAFDLSGHYLSQLKFLVVDKVLLNITFYKVGLFPLLIALVLIYRDYRKKYSFHHLVLNNFLLIVWSLTLILHACFGNFRGFFRYEAYILVAFSMILIPRLKDFFVNPFGEFKKDGLIGVFILCNVFLLVYKSGYAHFMMINGSRNIYEQQVQSARFLKKYYNTSKVVANDIGAICYFSDIHLFDIAGLGSKEMIPFNEKGKVFDQKFENFLTQYSVENTYELAIVYEEWFGGHVPKNWKKVAVLKINNNTNAALDHVTIYSIDPQVHDQLKENVKNFNWNKNVKVSIIQ